ncbi:hypothetical protein JOQ06_025971 [Pogonophryne albipinna]|uniref:Uncharacterized protein n=1 Tax=Pogonophryne albipinna TaxID=1090488 RepID=A0AAD6F4I5_9TELE|nr:hypothetical protein JOQ06_025971 [Pogonophryne albipinna]
MAGRALLRIIFADQSDSRKLTLDSGIPATVEELHTFVKTSLQLKEDFRLQYMDVDFNEFMNLTSVSEIQDKSTLKVIYSPILSNIEPSITLYTVDSFDKTSITGSSEPLIPASSIASCCSDDMVYTSTPQPSPEAQASQLLSWPTVFVVPKLTYEAEFELHLKNAEFETTGTYFQPGLKLKGVILDGLAQEMIKFTKYPKDYQCEEVAAALTRAHPCLGQLGSKTGFGGWKQSLKYKMQNYLTKLGRLGHPEILVNSLKHKKTGQGKAAANIKKSRKAEVNYIPLHPKGETTESLEKERIALLSELKKRDNEVVIKAKTFSHRRLEIVEQRPLIGDFKMQMACSVSAEEAFAISDSFENIHIKRGCILRSIAIYLNEDPDSFFKEYQASEDAKRDMANTVMGIYTLQRDVDGQPEDVGIVIEGNIVMDNLGSVIVGFVMLLGLIYALDLSFPDNLKHTFEFMQKVVMNLDGHKLNGKIESLKIKLLD